MTFNLGAALAVFLAAGASPGSSGSATPATLREIAPVVAPMALKNMLAIPNHLVLVDVREAEEFAAGHIEGAISMPLGTIQSAYRNLPRNVVLVVYCRGGLRSAQAVDFLLAHGYRHAIGLDGGIIAWNALPQ